MILMPFRHLNCITQCFLVYTQICETVITVNFRNYPAILLILIVNCYIAVPVHCLCSGCFAIIPIFREEIKYKEIKQLVKGCLTLKLYIQDKLC